jgi:hypothetical protein
MWMNLADLIHNRVADRKGNILPVDVNTVTYDLQNSTPRSYGLMANVLSIDSTLDSRVRSGYANCCSTINPGWDPSAVILGFGTNVTYGLDATDSCNGDQDDLLPDSSDWTSAAPSIAKVTKGEVAAVTTGSTTGSADVFVVQGVGGYCAGQLLPVTAPITVISFKATGKGYIFVGTDPNELYGNHYALTDSTGKQNPQPPGGTCCAASSDPSDTVTQTGTNPPTFQFETLDQSAAPGDRTLTFEYDLSGGQGASQQMNVTAREFAYLTNASPSNTCTLAYGTNRAYTYTVYTHPDHAAVLPTDGVDGTAVTESFNPSLTCETITGKGSLNANAQIIDNISSGCSSAPLTCTQTSTQTVSVAGYQVRTNTLEWTSVGVTYTSDGPTQ